MVVGDNVDQELLNKSISKYQLYCVVSNQLVKKFKKKVYSNSLSSLLKILI